MDTDMEPEKNRSRITEIFGEDVFDDTVMQERRPKKVYRELTRMIDEGIFIPYSRPFVDLMFHLLSHPNHRTRLDDTHPAPRTEH